jgi:hypothetical protein
VTEKQHHINKNTRPLSDAEQRAAINNKTNGKRAGAGDDGMVCVMPVPPDAGPPPKITLPDGRAVSAEFAYRSSSGELLGYVHRYDARGKIRKEFKFRTYWRPAGNGASKGKWLPKAWPKPWPLYGLDELAKKPNAVAFLLEGEGKADVVNSYEWEEAFRPSFAKREIVGLSWPGGASNVANADFTPLAGREAVAVPDNNAPGKKAADDVVEATHKAGVRIMRRWEPPETIPEGWDIKDGVPEKVNADELVAGILNAPEVTPVTRPSNGGEEPPPWEPPSEPEPGPRAEEPPSPKPKFKLTAFDDILLGTTAVDLVQGLIPRRGLVVIWGPYKCGKSFWTFDLFLHVSLGWVYRGRRVERGPVVYIALEGGEGFKKRKTAFEQSFLSEDHNPVPFYLITDPLNLIKDYRDLINCIRTQLGDKRPVAVVIDTLNRSLVGSENEDKDMGAYIKAADAVAAAFGCVVPVVHHCGVEGNRPRGHTSLTGAAEAQIAVRRDTASNVIVELEWMKDGEEGAVIASRLHVVEVGVNEYDDPITSCVVVPVDDFQKEAPKAKAPRMSKAAKIALRALHEAVDEVGAIPPASNHIPANTRTATVSQWRTYAYARGISAGEERAKQQAFKRATDLLIANQHVVMWGDQAWPIA